MVGLCGTIGKQNHNITTFVDSLRWSEKEERTTFNGSGVSVGYTDHPIEFSEQPAMVENGDVLIWVWGNLLGHEHNGEYVSRRGSEPDAKYCASLYDRYGLSFVDSLNSEFSGVIYNRREGTVSLFTDRLGSRPVYWTRAEDGSLVFSSLLQSLGSHPHVDLQFDREFVSEFLAYSRVLGIYTPVAGVQNLPPASVVTFDLDGEKIAERRYWQPELQPEQKSFSEFVDEFVTTFKRAVEERAVKGAEQGLLLSGGTDSRAVLSLLGEETIAFHMNEREASPETKVARRVATTAGAKFRYLDREISYYPGVLKLSGNLTNLNGLFRHAHPFGFETEITNEVDFLFCGQYSDTILSAEYIPKQDPPVEAFSYLYPSNKTKTISTPSEYVSSYINGSMGDVNGDLSYTRSLPNPTTVLESYLEVSDGVVTNHGVTYPSLKSLTEFGMIYPITNVRTFISYETMLQMTPTRYPFLDNRIVELALTLPESYRNRHDIVSSSLEQLDSDLASIKHPNGTRPTNSTIVNYYLENITTVTRRIRHISRSSDLNSWRINLETDSIPDHGELIRSHSFIEDIITDAEEEIEEADFLDLSDVTELYHAHLNGEDHTNMLYAIVTLLQTSVPLNAKKDAHVGE